VIEMSVGVGVGLIFLAREGLSFASLRRIEEEEEARSEEVLEEVDVEEASIAELAREPERAGAPER
jgi:hypothetical protein